MASMPEGEHGLCTNTATSQSGKGSAKPIVTKYGRLSKKTVRYRESLEEEASTDDISTISSQPLPSSRLPFMSSRPLTQADNRKRSGQQLDKDFILPSTAAKKRAVPVRSQKGTGSATTKTEKARKSSTKKPSTGGVHAAAIAAICSVRNPSSSAISKQTTTAASTTEPVAEMENIAPKVPTLKISLKQKTVTQVLHESPGGTRAPFHPATAEGGNLFYLPPREHVTTASPLTRAGQNGSEFPVQRKRVGIHGQFPANYKKKRRTVYDQSPPGSPNFATSSPADPFDFRSPKATPARPPASHFCLSPIDEDHGDDFQFDDDAGLDSDSVATDESDVDDMEDEIQSENGDVDGFDHSDDGVPRGVVREFSTVDEASLGDRLNNVLNNAQAFTRQKGEGVQYETKNDCPQFIGGFRVKMDKEKNLDWFRNPPADGPPFSLDTEVPSLPRLSADAQDLLGEREPLVFFERIFTPEIVEMVIRHTNNFARSDYQRCLALHKADPEHNARPQEWVDLDEVEFRGLIGCCLYQGITCINQLPLKDAFSTKFESVHLPLVQSFSRDRFIQILKYLRFHDRAGVEPPATAHPKTNEAVLNDTGPGNDSDAENDPWNVTNAAMEANAPTNVAMEDNAPSTHQDPVEEIPGNDSGSSRQRRDFKILALTDPIFANCCKLIEPGNTITLDEALVGYRGRVLWRQYIGSKPEKFGIKYFVLTDSSTGAILMVIPYLGKGDEVSKDLSTKIVLQMVERFRDSNMTIICDRGYTSPALVAHLVNMGLHFVGTCNTNRFGMPSLFCGKRRLDKMCIPPPPPANENSDRPATVNANAPSSRPSKKSKKVQSNNAAYKDKENDVTTSTKCVVIDDSGEEMTVQQIRAKISSLEALAAELAPPPPPEDAAPPLEDAAEDVRPPQPPVEEPKSTQKRKHPATKSGFVFSHFASLVRFEPTGDKNKNVFLLSTRHWQPRVSVGPRSKPEQVLYYNGTRFGVDLLDQMVKNYSSKRISRRWPLRLFFWVLDMAATQAYLVFRLANMEMTFDRNYRLEFLRLLANSLMLPLRRARRLSMTAYMQKVNQVSLAMRGLVAGRRFKQQPEFSLTASGMKALCGPDPKRKKSRRKLPFSTSADGGQSEFDATQFTISSQHSSAHGSSQTSSQHTLYHLANQGSSASTSSSSNNSQANRSARNLGARPIPRSRPNLVQNQQPKRTYVRQRCYVGQRLCGKKSQLKCKDCGNWCCSDHRRLDTLSNYTQKPTYLCSVCVLARDHVGQDVHID